MFAELSKLLRKGDTLVLTVSRESDTNLRVNVVPKLFTMDGEHGSDRKALNTPLSLTGTIEELDSPQFASTLERFTVSANGLRQSIDEIEASHKAAAAAKKGGKPADKTEKKPEPEKPKAAPTPEEQTPSII